MMHTEKNITEALFGTLFGIEGKSKDNTKARVDQEALCDRPLQNMQEPKGKKNWTKPHGSFSVLADLRSLPSVNRWQRALPLCRLLVDGKAHAVNP